MGASMHGMCRTLDGRMVPVEDPRDWEAIQRGLAGEGRYVIILVEDAMDRPHHIPIFADEDTVQDRLRSVHETKESYDEVTEVWDTAGATSDVGPPASQAPRRRGWLGRFRRDP